MKAKGKFISFLLVVDTFFAAYAYGFHCRHVLVIDPKMAPVAKAVLSPAAKPTAKSMAIPVAAKASSVKAVVSKTAAAKAKAAKKLVSHRTEKRP